MNLLDELRGMGIKVDEGLNRLGGNTAIYTKMVTITPLYEGYGEIVDLLRKGEPEQAREILVKLLPVQEQILGVIEKHAAGK